MQSLHKIFVVIQSHECRLPLWRLLHLNSLSTWFNPLSYLSYIMKSNFINIYFSNSLLKWLGLTLWITKLIKLISMEYFISPLRDYEFHLENIYSINRIHIPSILNAAAQHIEVLIMTLDLTPDISKRSNLHLIIRSIIFSGLRVYVNISCEIYYLFDSR